MERTIEVIKSTKNIKLEKATASVKRKVAAYARVSTDYEDQLNSYKVQSDEYTNYITSNPNYIFTGLFADQGLSGTQASKRPEFIKMIESARNGDIDLILTKSIFRFGCNTVDVISYIRKLRLLNVEIFFEKENISSLDPKIDFMLMILSSIAQEESRTIPSNVKWAIEKKAKNGIVDPRSIYGYNFEDGKYVINQDEAELIRYIFNLAMKRYNINDIVKALNANGYTTLKGATWKYGSVRHLLSNERYCGDALLRKTVCVDYLTKKVVKKDNIVDKYLVSNNLEPIISRTLFDDVQNILFNASANNKNSNKTSKYPLTGIIYCPKCGRTLKHQQVVSRKLSSTVLNCNHSYNNDFNCKASSPKYDLVIGAAIQSVKELFLNKPVLNTLFEMFDNNIHLNELREKQVKIKTDIFDLHKHLEINPADESMALQIIKSEERLNNITNDIGLNASAAIRLDYIRDIVKSGLEEELIVFKDIFSSVLADSQKVSFVISPRKTIKELVEEIPMILNSDLVISKMHLSEDDTHGIFYEVILYE